MNGRMNLGLLGRVDEVERDVGGLERGAGAVDGDDEEAAGLEQAVEGPERGAEEGGGVRQPPEVLRALVPHDPPERLSGRISVHFIQHRLKTETNPRHSSSVASLCCLNKCILDKQILEQNRVEFTHMGEAKTSMEITFPAKKSRRRNHQTG